jgi:hypothetical protein
MPKVNTMRAGPSRPAGTMDEKIMEEKACPMEKRMDWKNEPSSFRKAMRNPPSSPKISPAKDNYRSSSASVMSFSGPTIMNTPKATTIAPPRLATKTMGAATPYVAVEAPKDENMIATEFPKLPKMVVKRFEKAVTMDWRK